MAPFPIDIMKIATISFLSGETRKKCRGGREGGVCFEDTWHKFSVKKLTITSNFRFLNLHPRNPGCLVRTISLSTNLAKRVKKSHIKMPEPKLLSVVYEINSARFECLSLSNGGRDLISCVPN